MTSNLFFPILYWLRIIRCNRQAALHSALFNYTPLRVWCGSIRVPRDSIRVQRGSIRVPRSSIRVRHGAIRGRRGSIRVWRGSIRVQRGSIRVQCGSIRVWPGSIRVQRGSIRVQRGSTGSVCWLAVCRLPVHGLAVRQAQVWFSARLSFSCWLEQQKIYKKTGLDKWWRMKECMIVLYEWMLKIINVKKRVTKCHQTFNYTPHVIGGMPKISS
jgi:hypothetical protein